MCEECIKLEFSGEFGLAYSKDNKFALNVADDHPESETLK